MSTVKVTPLRAVLVVGGAVLVSATVIGAISWLLSRNKKETTVQQKKPVKIIQIKEANEEIEKTNQLNELALEDLDLEIVGFENELAIFLIN